MLSIGIGIEVGGVGVGQTHADRAAALRLRLRAPAVWTNGRTLPPPSTSAPPARPPKAPAWRRRRLRRHSAHWRAASASSAGRSGCAVGTHCSSVSLPFRFPPRRPAVARRRPARQPQLVRRLDLPERAGSAAGAETPDSWRTAGSYRRTAGGTSALLPSSRTLLVLPPETGVVVPIRARGLTWRARIVTMCREDDLRDHRTGI